MKKTLHLLILILPLVIISLICFTFSKAINDWSIFLHVFSEPLNSGRNGGLSSIIISTLTITTFSLLFALPFSLGFSYYLVFSRRTYLKFIPERLVEVLAAVPSIVFGLFGYLFFGELLGFGYSLLTGALTLSFILLPIMIKNLADSIKSIPPTLILASQSLGIKNASFFLKIVLPSIYPSLMLTLLLGCLRGFSETAALLFTSGYSDRMPNSLFDSGKTLSVHIYDLSINITGGESMAAMSSLSLFFIVFIFTEFFFNLSRIYQMKKGN